MERVQGEFSPLSLLARLNLTFSIGTERRDDRLQLPAG
jgi:hypothetical protein